MVYAIWLHLDVYSFSFSLHVFYKQMICLEVRVDFRPKLKALFEKYQFSEEMDSRK